MIDWKIITLDGNSQEVIIDLMASSSENHQLRETDYIQFKVTIDHDTLIEKGIPSILIADIPLEMEIQHHSGTDRVFVTCEPLGHHSSRFFYNFFGESELCLTFNKTSDYLATSTVNILARSDNAQLANEILGYITDNFEDAVAVCFSRSKISGGYNPNDSFNFSRLDIIERTITYLTELLPVFMREHKHTWKAEMQFSERGQPTGPDSVYWVLSNLDRLSPASAEESNLMYNGRSYRLDTLPKEGIISNSDIFENRVLHTFLHNTSLFLLELKENFTNLIKTNYTYSDNEYVRFDHTMQRYTQLALKHKTQHLESLFTSVEKIRRNLSKWLPAKIVPGIQPRMTAYVSKHLHYRRAFKLIEQCYSAPAPTFEGRNVLLGLKNLAIIYEVSTLLMLNESIKSCFSVVPTDQSYREHSSDLPFGGVNSERPYGEINNYFTYRNETYDIELFYEPKVFPYGSRSLIGDLVDTSDSKASTKYGAHHFCPDFIIKITSIRWRRPLTIVLDSKYKDASTVKKFDISPLTHQYLLNIHQVNEKGNLGISPIQLLLVLFAHDRTGSYVRTVAQRHCLTGSIPVLPQTAGILLKPNNTLYLEQSLRALIEIMDREQY